MFHLWFNTFFIEEGMKLVVPKMLLDKANKDKKHKFFPSDFQLEILFERPSGDMAAEVEAMSMGAAKPGLQHQGSTVSQDPDYSDSDLTDDDDDDDDDGNWEGMPVTDV